jgi:hypothetical protein
MAVGSDDNAAGAEQATAQEWNGTAWRLLTAGSPAGNDQLTGVSCTGPSACMAVGVTWEGAVESTLAERWNGRA